MEGELHLKCLFFNYKYSSSKQLFLTAGHQLPGVTEVFRQEINKWGGVFFFFLGQEKPLHNGCVSPPPARRAIRTWQAFKAARLFSAEGHGIGLGGGGSVVPDARIPGGRGPRAPQPPGKGRELDAAGGGCRVMDQQPPPGAVSQLHFKMCQI